MIFGRVLVVAAALVGPLAAMGAPREPELQAGCPAQALRITPGTPVQSAVAAAPEGASFCLGAGVHRGQAITPKNGQRFYGEAGTVLNGARLITHFVHEGNLWVVQGSTLWGRRDLDGICLPDWPRCASSQAVFRDDQPLRQVATRAAVTADTFFFDDESQLIYLGSDPAGRRLEVSDTQYAFAGSAQNVLLQGLSVEKYASPIQDGAIGSDRPVAGWVVRGNAIRLNHGVGVLVGDGSRVLGNRISGNGQLGIGCSGRDILVAQNEVSWNGYFAGVNPYWEAGGAKCAITTGLTVRDNHLHDNSGMGFWTDFDNIHTLYEANLVEHNRTGGISHEISYDAEIRNNVLIGNGDSSPVWLWGGAIQVQDSRNVDVHGNTVDMTEGGNGICLIQQNRGTGRYGPYATVGSSVHDNLIISRKPDHGVSGAIADHDAPGMRAGSNRFYNNTYQVSRAGFAHWAWIDGFFDWDEYRRRSGQDLTSKIAPPAAETMRP